MKKLLISLLLITCSVAIAADEPEMVTDKSLTIGGEFSRNFINRKNTYTLPESVKPFAEAVARFGRGTAFYIGGTAGHHYMVTAAHTALSGLDAIKPDEKSKLLNDPINLCRVFPGDPDSDLREFHLGLTDIYVSCKNLVFLDEDSDTAVYEVATFGQTMPIPIKISDYSGPLEYGARLAFFSYSLFKNLGTAGSLDLVFSTDSDCRNFSDSFDDKVSSASLIDNHEISHSVFVVGCDFVGGDSGGPVFNLDTGMLVGKVFGKKEEGLRKIGGSTKDLFQSFTQLSRPQQSQIKNNYLNYISTVSPEIKKLLH